MDTALTVIIAVITLALVYVAFPVGLNAYRRLRGVRTVACPGSGTPAEIELDALGGAITAATGRTVVSVAACSHWPERQHCGQECLPQVREAEDTTRAA